MAKKNKGKKVNIKGLDPDQVSTEMYICGLLGRALASFGSVLTGREKHNANLMYDLILAVPRLRPN